VRLHVTALMAVVLLFTPAAVQARSADRVDHLTTRQLYSEAKKAIANGAIHSMRWGDASPYLTRLCYEALERAFSPYGTEEWAEYVVRRESGCNPGAVNTTYSSWTQRAQCISQMIPAYHQWVDFRRCLRDLRYAVAVFVRLSRGGHNTQPWGG
jgi:hypothetical protein